MHEMKLYGPAFGRLERGEKTLELRLYDEKRRRIKVGDEIIFVEIPSGRTIRTEVRGLLVYPTFESLVLDTPASWMGYLESDKNYLKTSMYEVYTPDDEAKYGALGIRIAIKETGHEA